MFLQNLMAINVKRRYFNPPQPPPSTDPVGQWCSCDGRARVHSTSGRKKRQKRRRSQHGACLYASSVLPEVGDLLLSMSTDCWLSDSSVRPDGGDQGEMVNNKHPVKTFHVFLFFFSHQHNKEASLVGISHLRLHQEVSVRMTACSHVQWFTLLEKLLDVDLFTSFLVSRSSAAEPRWDLHHILHSKHICSWISNLNCWSTCSVSCKSHNGVNGTLQDGVTPHQDVITCTWQNETLPPGLAPGVRLHLQHQQPCCWLAESVA